MKLENILHMFSHFIRHIVHTLYFTAGDTYFVFIVQTWTSPTSTSVLDGVISWKSN